MDIQQPPRGADLNSPEMQRFLQDAYNSCKSPNFMVSRTGGHWTIPSAGSFLKIEFNTVLHNHLNGWDTTNYYFRPRVPGMYLIQSTLNLYYNYVTAGESLFHVHFKNAAQYNGVQHKSLNIGASGRDYTQLSTVSSLLYMNGLDDYVDVYVLKYAAGDILVLGNQVEQYPTFHGFKIGY